MTRERIEDLNFDQNSSLTQEEFGAGWHFCNDFDGLLVGPGMGELHFCTCQCAMHVPRPPVEPADPTAVF